MEREPNNPYGRAGKPEGPRGGGDLRARKAMEGISGSMVEVVNDERYGLNLRFLVAAYREMTGTRAMAFKSWYPQDAMRP